MQTNNLPIQNSKSQLSNVTYNSNPFSANNQNSNPIYNGLSDVRQEQQMTNNRANTQESLFPPPTGSSLLKNQQFLQSNVPPKSEIKKNEQSGVLVNPNQYSLLYSKPALQERSGVLAKSNIIMQSNINATNHKDNWGGIDYIRQFEDYNRILQENGDYLQYLSTLKLQIPNVKVIVKDLLDKREEIVQDSNTQDKTVYENYIQPRVQELINLTDQLQSALQELQQMKQVPYNPYQEGNDRSSKIQSNLQQLLFTVESELNNKQRLIREMIHLINQNKGVLVDEQIQESFHQRLERASEEIQNYLKEQLTQAMNQIYFIQEREIFNLQNDVQQHMHQQNMDGIVYFTEKFTIIDGQMQLFNLMNDQIKNYELQLNNMKRNYQNFQSFLEAIGELYQHYNKFIQEVKQVSQIPNEPILQRYQVKVKTKLISKAYKLRKEINLLFFNGQKIVNFNFEQKMQIYRQLNVEAQVQYIRQNIEHLNQQYIRRGQQCPLDEAKQLKDLIYKYFKQLFRAEAAYQQSSSIRQEIEDLERQSFIEYQKYVSLEIKPQFTVEFRNLLTDEFYEIIYFQFADAIILQTVKELMQFQFPQFDWNEDIEEEKQRIKIVEKRHQDVKEQLEEYIQDHSHSMKFMKQLSNWEAELQKCLIILQQYIAIKERIGKERISLLNWPTTQLEPIREFSVLCEQIIRQANQHLQAIEQLNQMNLMQNIRVILKGWTENSKGQLIEICEYLSERVFSPVISEQVQIAYEFLYNCMILINEDVDKPFCETTTYTDLEERFGGMKKFNELKSVYENVYNLEVRFQLFELVEQFIREKVTLDFQNLFQLKLIQCSSGDCNYDPNKLALRTDLLYPIYRADMQDNQYCQQNMDRIKQYVDQPELRQVFQDFKEFIKQVTSILDQDTQILDLSTNQGLILDLVNSFEQQQVIKNQLTDIGALKRFHEQLLRWPSQLDNQLVQLGLVVQEYQNYLKACRNRVMKLVNGVCLEIDSLDKEAISSVIFVINGQEYSLHQIDLEWYYRDVQSVILKNSGLIYCKSHLKVMINGKQI